ncbi:MAG TPA: MFS transporter, partial [Gemmatimonadaceae bacterium]
MTRPRTSGPAAAGGEKLSLGSAAGRWIVAASVLGSGAVFLESTVVTVALPAIAREFALDLGGLQWVVDGYLLTLGALMLLGGSLGDRLGRRRVFAWGAVAFAVISTLCAVAPTLRTFLALRLLQGAAGALLVPNSLALLEASFDGEEQGVAIGRWAGWSAVSTAAGPLLGGWVVDAMSWRWVFGVITPVSLAAAWIIMRQAPIAERGANAGRSNAGRTSAVRTADGPAMRRIDWPGATLATTGLGAIVWALIEGPARGMRDPAVVA